jgi:hypothetical protein
MQNQKRFSVLIGIIIIITLVAVLVGGGLLYKHYYTIEHCLGYIINGKCVPLKPVSSAPLSSAGWKTYTNQEYGFEFKYPADWSLINNPDNAIVAVLDVKNPTLTGGAPGLTVNDLSISFCNTDCLAKKNLSLASSIQDYITANTYPGYKYTEPKDIYGGKVGFDWIVSPVGSIAFHRISIPAPEGIFDLEYFENPKPETNQIISTFKSDLSIPPPGANLK